MAAAIATTTDRNGLDEAAGISVESVENVESVKIGRIVVQIQKIKMKGY
jgi:hypothetical protein